MADSGGGGGGSGSGGHSWLDSRQSNKRNFSTMSASHRDETPDSLFLPQNHYDPHYNNEHASTRRRTGRPWEMERRRSGRDRYAGDGLDFRRPVTSTRARESSMDYESVRETPVDEGNMGQSSVDVEGVTLAPAAPAPAPPVIDLTDEIEELIGRHDEVEVTGASDAGMNGTSSRAGGGQRLPRFGRDLIDAEDRDQQNTNFQPQNSDYDNEFAQLPGANYLALPPRRSASGRVQYSTLRRPTQPPSPPPDMDDGEIEYLGARPFANIQERRPTPGPAAWLNNNIPRSVTPYPADMNAPIDLTDDVDDADDDLIFVDERRRSGVNLDLPNGNIGTRTQAGEPGGFGLARVAGLLRDQGAAIGGRLAERVQNYRLDRDRELANITPDELHARRVRLEEQLREHRERTRRQREVRYEPLHSPRRGHQAVQVPVVNLDANGNAPGYHAVGWFAGPPGNRGPPIQNPNYANLGNMMDYGMAAFDMGYGGNENRNRPPTPKYSPPPEPEKGFTRNPGEDEVVVCPNCGDELAVGEEESKQEIWVNKACGHAYCGDCAQHRTKSRNKKGKGRAVDDENLPPPFKNCVVSGCGKSTSGKAMVRVYFGS